MVHYEGIFFENKNTELLHSLETHRLPIINDELHCTFKYHPNENEIFNDIVGKYFEIIVIGYGNDGFNSGFEVIIPDELKPYYINYDEQNPTILKTPHITASLAEDATANNTQNLKFELLTNPIKIKGRFGYWIKENENEYLSFNPININKKGSTK